MINASEKIVASEKIILASISAIILLITARWMPLKDFSILALTNAVILFATITTAGPLAQSLNRFLPRFSAINPKFNGFELLAAVERRALFLSLFTLPIPLFFWSITSSSQFTIQTIYLYLLTIIALNLRINYQIRYRFFHSDQQHLRACKFSISEATLRMLLVIFLILCDSLDVFKFLVIYIVTHLFAYLIYRDNSKYLDRYRSTDRHFLLLIKYSIPMVFIGFFQWAQFNGYRFLVDYFGSTADQAEFAFLQQLLYQPLIFLTSIVLTVRAPLFFQARHKNNKSLFLNIKGFVFYFIIFLNSSNLTYFLFFDPFIFNYFDKFTINFHWVFFIFVVCINISYLQFRVIDLMHRLKIRSILIISALANFSGLLLIFWWIDHPNIETIYLGLLLTSTVNVIGVEGAVQYHER